MKPCCQCGPHRLTGVEATSTLESRRLCIWPNVERGSCLEKPVWPKSLHSLPVEHALIIPINQPANTLLQGSNEISIPLTDLVYQKWEYIFIRQNLRERIEAVTCVKCDALAHGDARHTYKSHTQKPRCHQDGDPLFKMMLVIFIVRMEASITQASSYVRPHQITQQTPTKCTVL